MKFIFFTDVHDTSKSPRYRKDDFHQSMLKKLAWIGEYAKTIDAHILCGGDVFNTPGVSNSTIGDVLRVLSKNFDRPVYCVAGNHDLYGNNSFNIEKTGLGVLFASGLFERLDNASFTDEDMTVNIFGIESYSGIDSDVEKHLGAWIPDSPDSANILVSHAMILKKKKDIMKCIGVEELLSTKADVILSGHDHAGFGAIHENDKWFCNPGALGRVSTASTDVNLEVKIAVITIDSCRGIDIDFIPLPKNIALPAEEVLDIEAAQEEKAALKAAQNWISHINASTGAVSNMGEEEIVDKFIAELGFSSKVKELFYDYLKEAKEQLKETE